jgi:hypothetical protein
MIGLINYLDLLLSKFILFKLLIHFTNIYYNFHPALSLNFNRSNIIFELLNPSCLLINILKLNICFYFL